MNMKTLFVIIMVVLSVAWMPGCSSQLAGTPEREAPSGSLTGGEENSLPSASSAPVNTEALPEEIGDTVKSVDVDLTILSSTMVYAEVYNIMLYPDEYIKKTMKLQGTYSLSYYDVNDQYYHFLIIEDATACCAQGLELIWGGDQIDPAHYPADGETIEVTGVFDSYEEAGQTYYGIAVQNIKIGE